MTGRKHRPSIHTESYSRAWWVHPKRASKGTGVRPTCFTDDEYEGWSAANDLLGMNRAISPCWDCTARWHREMLAAGTCDGEPQTGRGGRPNTGPEYLRRLSLPELVALRRTLPRFGAPPAVARAICQARWREYRRALRLSA